MAIKSNTGDSSDCSSPRISFSKDLPEKTLHESQEVEVIRLDSSLLLDSNSDDFDFCVSNVVEKEVYYSPADELFFNGMIIPTQMKQKLISISKSSKEEEDEEEITWLTTATLIREEKIQSNSIWRFKRSCSLNCENYGQNKKSSAWSLPNLFRSNSTGPSSVSSLNVNSKQTKKHANKFLRNPTSKCSCPYNNQKPPLKKSRSNGSGFGGLSRSYSVNSGVRTSHVLNVPSPYIAKGTSDLLGFGTLFRGGSTNNTKSRK